VDRENQELEEAAAEAIVLRDLTCYQADMEAALATEAAMARDRWDKVLAED
jgi:hypothetical protein